MWAVPVKPKSEAHYASEPRRPSLARPRAGPSPNLDTKRDIDRASAYSAEYGVFTGPDRDPALASSHAARRFSGTRQRAAYLPLTVSLAAAAPALDHTSVRDYTSALLLWWRTHHPRMPAWAEAARIAFALTCTSAASERVFSLVEGMFGTDQLQTLADQLQGSVMLRYNKRQVG